ncbi:OmpA family protein [Sabulicella glaciei]|uniref:OmpA-like domain-containing protein n=1 Tax=Sabulicella glaciei TaxID=2984948 RepID=A0ABT3NQA1_9PROT|nr:OmpA family protein [Roseococcus sp. MDT2-1-1]MCW8084342.1 hypothetical protein [Roseococcus sp. MDT2-1-1]
MMRTALATLLLLSATPAGAQIREFSCVGAERLEEDYAIVAFGRARDRAEAAALDPLGEIVAQAKATPSRNLCVLGFAAPDEGGAETASRLAARRARSISEELAKMGLERDRIRAEARTRGFVQRGPAGVARASGVRVVLMPPSP